MEKSGRKSAVLTATVLAAAVLAAVALWAVLNSPLFLPRDEAPLEMPPESGVNITVASTYDGERAESRAEQLRQNARGMTVRIQTDSSFGSGVIFTVTKDSLYVATAAHVLSAHAAPEKEEVLVTFCDGWAVPCGEILAAEDADLAFLRIPLSELTEDGVSLYRYAAVNKEAYDALTGWDTVLCMGIRETDEPVVFEGYLLDNWIYVEDFAQYMILANCQLYPGMSGGGLYDGQGHLIGIACGGNDKGELAAVPLSVAQAQFQMIAQAETE